MVAEKSGSLSMVPRLASSSRSVWMLSKCVRTFPFSVQRVSCNRFHSSIVIIRDSFSKSALRVSQASFTVGFPLIFRYNESGIVEAICWKTIACSCEYLFISFSLALTSSGVKAEPLTSAPVKGSMGRVAVPSRWPYRPQARIESSSLSFQTTKPFPSAGSLGTRRKSFPSLSWDIIQ